MKKLLTFTICLLFISCSYIRSNNEKFFYIKSKNALKKTVIMSGYDKSCSYNWDTDKPHFFPYSKESNSDPSGMYFDNSILYRLDFESVIVHETFHHFANNGKRGPVTRRCLEETAAVLLDRVVYLEGLLSR